MCIRDSFVHRRDDFRGAQATVDKVRQLAKEGKIDLLTKFQMTGIKGENKLESIDIKHDNNEIKNLKSYYVLGFFIKCVFYYPSFLKITKP